MPTITADNGGGTSSPLAILTPWAAGWPSRNVFHDLIGGDIAVSLAKARPRSGEFQALFDNDNDALDCVALHRTNITTFTLTDSGRGAADMGYALDGEVRMELQANLTYWVVTIGYVRMS
jgi:hypothetical protein